MTEYIRIFITFFWVAVFSPLAVFSATPGIDVLEYDIRFNAAGVLNNGVKSEVKISLIKSPGNPTLTLDLLGYTVDSIFVNSLFTTFGRTDSTVIIDIPATEVSDDTITLTVYYQGQGQKDPLWGGFYISGNYAFNMGVGFASDPHNFGRAWFPCNDNFTDRALYKVSVTTSPGFTAVCGGILVGEVTNGDGTKTWFWELNQPIPTYLASVAIGKYVFVKYEFTGIQDTLPVWLAAEAKDTASLKLSFVRLNNALHCFEERFGPYLFDRVGYVGVPFNSGAMEHAANIAYPLYAINGNTTYETLMAHELSHHWWGNLATCRTAGDMWLNEGWASYCEALFLECAYGKSSSTADLREKLNEVLLTGPKEDKGYIAVHGIPHEQTYGTHVYKKGALMANTLRSLMGDSAFFAACRSYLSKYKFADVSTIELRNEFQQFTTADLTRFFEQYIYTKGHYDVVVASWEKNGSNFSADLLELKRYKTADNPSMDVALTVYFTDGSNQKLRVAMLNGKGNISSTLPAGKDISYFMVDDEIKYALAYTSDQVTITKKGTLNFPNTLLSINTQSITDTVRLHVQHHWVSPMQGSLRETGIRISPDHYWSVRGNFPSSFSAWAFFNYDGSQNSFLDDDLFNYTELEDSLVLLYRSGENQPWEVVSNVNFQPGGNMDDKQGRFWLNKLIAGDYAIALRDATVVGVQENKSKALLSISPNPVDKKLVINLPGDLLFKDTRVMVYDFAGKLVYETIANTSSKSFGMDTTSLSPGTYTLIVSHQSSTFSIKFVRE